MENYNGVIVFDDVINDPKQDRLKIDSFLYFQYKAFPNKKLKKNTKNKKLKYKTNKEEIKKEVLIPLNKDV